MNIDAASPDKRISCPNGHTPAVFGQWIKCSVCRTTIAAAPKPKLGRTRLLQRWAGVSW